MFAFEEAPKWNVRVTMAMGPDGTGGGDKEKRPIPPPFFVDRFDKSRVPPFKLA